MLLSDGSFPWSSNRSNSVCVAFFMLSSQITELLDSPLLLSSLLIKRVGHEIAWGLMSWAIRGNHNPTPLQPALTEWPGDAGLYIH